jgi:hypothetical protein
MLPSQLEVIRVSGHRVASGNVEHERVDSDLVNGTVLVIGVVVVAEPFVSRSRYWLVLCFLRILAILAMLTRLIRLLMDISVSTSICCCWIGLGILKAVDVGG